MIKIGDRVYFEDVDGEEGTGGGLYGVFIGFDSEDGNVCFVKADNGKTYSYVPYDELKIKNVL